MWKVLIKHSISWFCFMVFVFIMWWVLFKLLIFNGIKACLIYNISVLWREGFR